MRIFRRLVSSIANLFVFFSSNDLYVDGIGYRVASRSKQRVIVSASHLIVPRTLELPSEVRYKNKTYTVWGMKHKAFASRRFLQSVVLPDSIVQISECAFDGCPSLQRVTIPSSIEVICFDAFRRCKSLSLLRVCATTPPTLERFAFERSLLPQISLEVPEQSLDLYRNSETWKDFGSISAIKP